MTAVTKAWPNIPTHVETFVHPHVPSYTPNVKRLYAVCRADEAAIRGHLARTPFEYVNDLLMIEVADYSGRTYPADPGGEWPFMDCGITIPIRYKGRNYSYYLFEYEDQDYSIFAGRELWGYPKTYADVALTEGDEIVGSVHKGGKEIVRLTGYRGRAAEPLPDIAMGPVLNVHTVPQSDGPGIFSQRLILRDTSSGFKIKSHEMFEAKVELQSIRQHPLAELGIREALGGGYQVADYAMDEKTGWGSVLETLI